MFFFLSLFKRFLCYRRITATVLFISWNADYCDFGLVGTPRDVTSLAWGAGLEALRLVLAAGATFRRVGWSWQQGQHSGE